MNCDGRSKVAVMRPSWTSTRTGISEGTGELNLVPENFVFDVVQLEDPSVGVVGVDELLVPPHDTEIVRLTTMPNT